MKKTESRLLGISPDQIKLTPIQAERLGALNDVSQKDLVGMTVAQISDKFRFKSIRHCFFSARYAARW